MPPSPGDPWQVDIVNGNRQLVIAITTDQASWAWLVPAKAEMVLLNEPEPPREGRIQLIDPIGDCLVFDTSEVLVASFTIHAEQTAFAPPDVSLELTAGAQLRGLPNTDYFGGCSG